jgi:hypothetical protein
MKPSRGVVVLLNLPLDAQNMILRHLAGNRKIHHHEESDEHKKGIDKKLSFAALCVGRIHGIKVVIENQK